MPQRGAAESSKIRGVFIGNYHVSVNILSDTGD